MDLIRKGELDLESLVSAPLIAASKANEAILKQQTQFILDTCFTLEEDIQTPVMVKMRLSKTGIDFTKPNDELLLESHDIFFQVPLICLIPINSLGVNSIDVDFNVEVSSMKSSTSSSNASSAVLSGRLAPTQANSKRNASSREQSSGSLQVNLKAGALPLPSGVLELIDIYTKTIQPVVSTNSNIKSK